MTIFFDIFLQYLKDFIAGIGVFVIASGAARSLYQIVLGIIYKHLDINYVRLDFGNCVLLGLEFIVGADILGSLIKPDYYNLGLLAILVLIRTILSYFLSSELRTSAARGDR